MLSGYQEGVGWWNHALRRDVLLQRFVCAQHQRLHGASDSTLLVLPQIVLTVPAFCYWGAGLAQRLVYELTQALPVVCRFVRASPTRCCTCELRTCPKQIVRFLTVSCTMFLCQKTMKPRCVTPAHTEKVNAPWIGGSILASLGSFQQRWCSRQEYDEYGAASTKLLERCVL